MGPTGSGTWGQPEGKLVRGVSVHWGAGGWGELLSQCGGGCRRA